MTARLRALLAPFALNPVMAGGVYLIDLPFGIDAVRPILATILGERALRMRWGIGVASDPAAARVRARDALSKARDGRRLLGAATEVARIAGDLDDRAAVLDALLADTTPRQGEIARRLLVEGRRQAEIAADLGVSRATVSVSVSRGRVAAIAAAHRLLRTALAEPAGTEPDLRAEMPATA